MDSKKLKNILNRYTSLPVLLDMLWKRRLVLLDPSTTWEDKNDTYFLAKYKDEQNFRSVLALCFSMSSERFHHWKVFANGIGGVCVEFDKEALLSHVETCNGVRHGKVSYRAVEKLRKRLPSLRRLPFIKRLPYRDEVEYRLIYEDPDETMLTYDIAITPKMIRRITLSPNMPLSVANTVREIVYDNEEFGEIKVNRSTLLENERWKGVADSLATSG